MALPTIALNAGATGISTPVTHIALTGADGSTELSGGSYARVAVTWAAASGGERHPNADLTFNVPAGATVGGWLGFTASTGGTSYGGNTVTNEVYAGAGQYVLQAAGTAYKVS